MSIIVEEIKVVLLQVIDFNIGKDLICGKEVCNICFEGGCVLLDVELGYLVVSQIVFICQVVEEVLGKLLGVIVVDVNVYFKIVVYVVQCGIKFKSNVKNIIVVVLGKGGVGKFIMVVNLVLVLLVEGVCVGILDVDIYGFL